MKGVMGHDRTETSYTVLEDTIYIRSKPFMEFKVLLVISVGLSNEG